MQLNYFVKKNKLYHLTKAFTLVELLVVLGLFSSISTLSLGALFNAQAINTHLQETQSILDNVNLSVQTITRDIRFGSEFRCIVSPPGYSAPYYVLETPQNCTYASSTPGDAIGFKMADAATSTDRVAYYVDNGILYKKEFYQNPASTTVLQMTSSEVKINTLTFYIEGAENSTALIPDYKQPLVTMLISGVTRPSTIASVPVEFNLEVIMSGRQPDNK
jgi:prepilin-type N-terminal cleavage/methylation domain-containing protein